MGGYIHPRASRILAYVAAFNEMWDRQIQPPINAFATNPRVRNSPSFLRRLDAEYDAAFLTSEKVRPRRNLMPRKPPDPDSANVVPIRPARGKGSRGPMSPEAKARWKASVAKSNNKPAAGLPASGSGWGGPARGPGDQRPMTPDHPEHARNLAPDDLAARKAKRLEEAEKLLDVIVTAAMDEEQPMTLRVNAAIAGRAQIVGTPVQRNINTDVPAKTVREALMDFAEQAEEAQAAMIADAS
jgi:hypothetical protein